MRDAEEGIDRPVFVIGTGRSGSTALMELIAYHHAFAWPSQYNDHWPREHRWSFASRIVDLPIIRTHRRLRFVPKHGEAFALWNSCYPAFARPFRDLVADDVTPYVRRRFRTAVADVMRYQGKRRFITKYTGWSRIEFIRAIFPDARFIHIVRDGRAVANSLLSVDWWQGWEGVYRWRWGVPSQETLDALARYDDSFLALAALQWKILVRNISEKSALLPAEDVLVIRYEDLISAPEQEVIRCVGFCAPGEVDPRFADHIAAFPIVDANTTARRIAPWRDNVTRAQMAMLTDLIGEELGRFGYLAQ
jgi:hypothetical protein